MRLLNEATLLNKRQVTLILRLVLDADGRLEYGEAVDTEARIQGRFAGWRGLTRTIREWLARQERGESAYGETQFGSGRDVSDNDR